MAVLLAPQKPGWPDAANYFGKSEASQANSSENQKKEATATVTRPAAGQNHAARAHFEFPFISLG
jgi:hypothetical protein